MLALALFFALAVDESKEDLQKWLED